MPIHRSGRRSSACVLSAIRGFDVERLEVEVGEVEAVEHHDAARAGVLEPDAANAATRRVVRRDLHGDRASTPRRRSAPRVRVARPRSRAPPVRRVGGDRVQVQLDRVGAGVLEQPGVADPPADVRAVEAGDHRDVDAVLGGFDQRQVGVGAGVVAVDLREERRSPRRSCSWCIENSRSISLVSCSICSSNSDGSTTAPTPASCELGESCRGRPVSGPGDATIGDRSCEPEVGRVQISHRRPLRVGASPSIVIATGSSPIVDVRASCARRSTSCS